MKHSHYHKDVTKLKMVDVYRVLDLYNVTDPCIQHAVKKLLVAGGRGAGKDISQDIQEAIDSLERWQEMRREDIGPVTLMGKPYQVVDPDAYPELIVACTRSAVEDLVQRGHQFLYITKELEDQFLMERPR